MELEEGRSHNSRGLQIWYFRKSVLGKVDVIEPKLTDAVVLAVRVEPMEEEGRSAQVEGLER
jgi:hypothetical protein